MVSTCGRITFGGLRRGWTSNVQQATIGSHGRKHTHLGGRGSTHGTWRHARKGALIRTTSAACNCDGVSVTPRDGHGDQAQYWEHLPQGMRRASASHPVLRLLVRHERMEASDARIMTAGGAQVGTERRERAKIRMDATRRMAEIALALDGLIGFDDAVAVDGSDDHHEDEESGEVGQHASAWGSWNGLVARGAALAQGCGNYIA